MPEWKHTHLLLTPELVKAIDQWRKRAEIIPDRNRSIRYLLIKALRAEGIQVRDEDESGQAQD